MTKVVKEKIIVFYDDDADGFGGAWAARKRFGKKAKHIPITVRDGEAPCPISDKKVYFIDAVFGLNSMKKIFKDNFVVIIDHHKSRRAFVRKADNWVFDTSRAACVLAWQHFFPKDKIPWLLRYIEDMDLWTWKTPRAREITAAIDSYSHNFKTWDMLFKRLETPTGRKELFQEGTALVRQEEKMINKLLVSHAKLVEFEGKQILSVNTPVLHDRVANKLAEKQPPFGLVWHRKGDMWKISLRSRGRFDVSKIAEKYGGGGHKNAAGFWIPASKKLPFKFVKE